MSRTESRRTHVDIQNRIARTYGHQYQPSTAVPTMTVPVVNLGNRTASLIYCGWTPGMVAETPAGVGVIKTAPFESAGRLLIRVALIARQGGESYHADYLVARVLPKGIMVPS